MIYTWVNSGVGFSANVFFYINIIYTITFCAALVVTVPVNVIFFRTDNKSKRRRKGKKHAYTNVKPAQTLFPKLENKS